MRLRLVMGDIIIAVVIVCIAIFIYWGMLSFAGGEGEYLVILHDGEEISRLSLGEDIRYTIEEEYENTFEIIDGEVMMVHSDCPGGDCLLSGSIHSEGSSIICLPNRVELRIIGDGDSKIDGVVE